MLFVFRLSAQQLKGGEYFFDTDPGTGKGTAFVLGSAVDSTVYPFSFKTTGLNIGYHKLYIRFKNTNGLWGLTDEHLFYVYDNQTTTAYNAPQINGGEYFFDTDPGKGKGKSFSFSAIDSSNSIKLNNISISNLTIGFHKIYVRIKDTKGIYGLTDEFLFYIYDTTKPAKPSKIVAMEYFFDNEDVGVGQCNPFSPITAGDEVTITQDLPLISLFGLDAGQHTLNIRAKDADGHWSLFDSKVFTICTQKATANFSVAVDDATVTLTNSSLNDFGTKWIFGDGKSDTARDVVHTYANGGVMRVKLVAYSGCGNDTAYKDITLNCVTPTASFNSSIDNLTVDFTNTSQGGSTFLWDFGDSKTTILENPTHVFQKTSTYNVCLTAANGCGSNTKCQNVSVTCKAPVAGFAYEVNGQTVILTDTSKNAYQFVWNFGNTQTNNTDHNPIVQYANAGSYTIKLTGQNGCGTNVFQKTVTLNCIVPQPSFNSITDGLNMEVENTSLNGTSWKWNFGDASTSIFKNPAVHKFPSNGAYTVRLVATNSCGSDSISKTISVCTKPMSTFINNISGLNVAFTNTSSNFDGCYWTFGDGNATNTVNPKYDYPTSKSYNVCLQTFNGCGTDTICKNIIPNCTPLKNQTICLVTVDTASLKNMIVWEKTQIASLQSYIIYKETTMAGQYQKIGNVKANLFSAFVDTSSRPMVQSDRYKISVVDTCGNESALSDHHRTLHLTVSKNAMGSGFNLNWQDSYEGFTFYTYYILRKASGGKFLKIDSISNNKTSYTDPTNLTGLVQYAVAAVKPDAPCNPTGTKNKGVFPVDFKGASFSNVDGFDLEVGLKNNYESSIKIYPNPANNLINIAFDKRVVSNKIEIFNTTGQLIFSKKINSVAEDIEQIDVTGFTSGLYFVKVQSLNSFIIKKFIKE